MTADRWTLASARAAAARLAPHIVQTPVLPWYGPGSSAWPEAELFIKLELLQRTGSFKARGALNTLLLAGDLTPGVTAFSAGNHAIAVAWAAKLCGTTARVVMPRSANAFRVQAVQDLGADIVYADDMADLVSRVQRLVEDEGRLLVHPFEGLGIIEGTSTVGCELAASVPGLDAVIVPVGGGGLIAGVASATKALQPGCEVIGVEPEGACGMSDSLARGAPLATVALNSIADSLSAPLHLPLSFALVQRHVDDMVRVSDDALREAMRRVFGELKLAIEPACAASFAALSGPLKARLAGRRVAIVACGSNIDIPTFQRLLD